jgi:18S rRNA (guanine1575-N7)-methyltransferase
LGELKSIASYHLNNQKKSMGIEWMGRLHRERKRESCEFFIRKERPEEIAGDPLQFYTQEEVQDYAQSKSMMRIQEKITQRILSIAQISPPAQILDLGMGCGFSTSAMFLRGYRTVGLDLSILFLRYLPIPELNPVHADMRQIPFAPASFDAIVSVSAIQWLLAEKNVIRRSNQLQYLATTTAELLRPGGKIILQFYPKSDDIMKELGAIFADIGKYNGTFIVDNLDSPKKRKIYLYCERNSEK